MQSKQDWINKLTWCGLKSNLMRNILTISGVVLLVSSATILFSAVFSMVQNAERPDYMLYTLREMVAPLHLMGSNAWGPLLSPVFILPPVLLCSFLLIYQCFYLSIRKDIKMYALMMICGLTAKQQRTFAVKQGLALWASGALMGFPVSLSVGFFIFSFINWKIDPAGSNITFSWSSVAFFLACLISLPVVLLGARQAFDRLQKISPATALCSDTSPFQMSLRETSAMISGATLHAAKAGVRSWNIWNRFKSTKRHYLSEEAKQKAILDKKKKQWQNLMASLNISTSYAKLPRMAFMNTLRNLRINGSVILSLCIAVLLFSLANHLTFGLDEGAYTNAKLENHDFVLMNATCLTNYYDPDPPLLTPPMPQHVFGSEFLKELEKRDGLTVSIVEVEAGSERKDSSLKTIHERMVFKVNIDTDEVHFLETEEYIENRFQNNYQVRIQNRALLAFQIQAQLLAAYLLGALLIFVIALTGILGFVNTSAISMESRKGEFAVLCSIGMTSAQLCKMILMEGLILSFIVIAITAPFLIPPSSPALWVSVYIMISFLLTCIPYIVYKPEKKKSISKTLQEIL